MYVYVVWIATFGHFKFLEFQNPFFFSPTSQPHNEELQVLHILNIFFQQNKQNISHVSPEKNNLMKLHYLNCILEISGGWGTLNHTIQMVFKVKAYIQLFIRNLDSLSLPLSHHLIFGPHKPPAATGITLQ